MIARNLMFAAAAAGLIAGPTLAARQTPQEELDKLLTGYTAEKPVSCINQRPQNRSQTIYGLGIIYTVAGKRYLNRFSDSCPELTSNRILVTRTFSTFLCRGDIGQVIDQQVPLQFGNCIFGDFVPYRRVAQAR